MGSTRRLGFCILCDLYLCLLGLLAPVLQYLNIFTPWKVSLSSPTLPSRTCHHLDYRPRHSSLAATVPGYYTKSTMPTYLPSNGQLRRTRSCAVGRVICRWFVCTWREVISGTFRIEESQCACVVRAVNSIYTTAIRRVCTRVLLALAGARLPCLHALVRMVSWIYLEGGSSDRERLRMVNWKQFRDRSRSTSENMGGGRASLSSNVGWRTLLLGPQSCSPLVFILRAIFNKHLPRESSTTL